MRLFIFVKKNFLAIQTQAAMLIRYFQASAYIQFDAKTKNESVSSFWAFSPKLKAPNLRISKLGSLAVERVHEHFGHT